MSKKKIIISILCILVIGLGAALYKGCSNRFKNNKQYVSVSIDSSIIKNELIKIDSLKKEIKCREDKISQLKDSIRVKETIRTIEIDNIKKLPLDSSVMFLKLKLREYEDKY